MKRSIYENVRKALRLPDFDLAYYVGSIGDVYYDGGSVGSSYGKYLEILYSKLFHGYTSTFTINLGQPDYWWLRSPVTRSNTRSWLVHPVGYVYSYSDWDVAYSYGKNRSPVTNYYNYFAHCVRSVGDVDSNNGVYDSYGFALRIVIITVFLMAVRRIWYENMAVLIIIIAVQKVMAVMSTIPTDRLLSGGFALRAHILTSTLLLSTRMATSTTTATASVYTAIPTVNMLYFI